MGIRTPGTKSSITHPPGPAGENNRSMENKKTNDHYRMLLMASYCDDNPECTDKLPCEECLKMGNIVLMPKDQIKTENIIGSYNILNKK